MGLRFHVKMLLALIKYRKVKYNSQKEGAKAQALGADPMLNKGVFHLTPVYITHF